jgi:hypothetical protein
MFRLLISALAAFVIVRVLVGLFRAVASGLHEGGHDSVQDGRGASGPTSGPGRAAGESAARRPPIDRDSAIDVSYTEVETEPAPADGQERRAG